MERGQFSCEDRGDQKKIITSRKGRCSGGCHGHFRGWQDHSERGTKKPPSFDLVRDT